MLIFMGSNSRRLAMAQFVYKKLWKMLIDRDLKKKDLQSLAHISASSVAKLVRNENVNTSILMKICDALNCDITDIVEIENDDQVFGYKTIDLFSGCGGMSLGFQNAGFDIVAAYDNWNPAVKVYRKNFHDHPIFDNDLSDEKVQNEIAMMRPEIIIGGPPCQDFSSAGHRDVSLGRAALTLSYKDIILKARPPYFVMENVPQIQKYDILNTVIDCFHDAGYSLTQIVLDASYCGVPQSRKRYFLIGALNSKENFLEHTLSSNQTPNQLTMREYFESIGVDLGIDYYFRVPRSYSRRGIFSIDEPCQTIRGVDRPIPPGYPGHPSDPVPMGPNVKALSIEERSYVQTFPVGFEFEGNRTDLNQMIGNAVPVKLAQFVANALKEYIETRERV